MHTSYTCDSLLAWLILKDVLVRMFIKCSGWKDPSALEQLNTILGSPTRERVAFRARDGSAVLCLYGYPEGLAIAFAVPEREAELFKLELAGFMNLDEFHEVLWIMFQMAARPDLDVFHN